VNSVLARLLAWQIGTLIITAAFVTALTYRMTWNEFSRSRDLSLEQVAWAVMRHHGMHPEIYDLSNRQESIISQVWGKDGKLLFASRPDLPLPRHQTGFSTFTWQEQEWHAVVIEDRGSIVQVATPSDSHALWFREFGSSLIVPFTVLVVIMGSFIAIAAAQAFQPLRQLRQEIRERAPGFLSPIPRGQYPDEMLVIVDALNDMFQRLDQAFLARQRFIADAAHELRTPLTALQLNAQVVSAESDPLVRQEALNNLRSGVDRAAHLVSQLLHLARFDPQFAGKRAMAPVDLLELAKTVIIECDILAAAKDIDLGLAEQMPTTLTGEPEALRVLLANLIDNAIRYTPAAGRIDISVTHDQEHAHLIVADNGPGIPAGEHERVFEAFCRLATTIPGSGLGLAIAREIVRQHDGQITLDDTPGGGLTVRVDLPLK
jgi:two-component system OmpR family sensor kinase